MVKTPEVGGEIEAYCTKCKADSGHVIVALSGDEVKRVECKVCGGQHNYRRPKSAAAEPKVKKPRKTGERKSRAAAVIPDLETWDTALRGSGSGSIKNYSQEGIFETGQLVSHPKFGMGKIEDVLRNKMRVAFREGQRTLICRDKRA